VSFLFFHVFPPSFRSSHIFYYVFMVDIITEQNVRVQVAFFDHVMLKQRQFMCDMFLLETWHRSCHP
jgi:hypothetical protein